MNGGEDAQIQVFISSTNELSLEKYRAGAREVCEELNLKPVEQRGFFTAGVPWVVTCQAYLKTCQIFVMLVARTYGSTPPYQTRSYTEVEFETAQTTMRPDSIHVYVVPDDHYWPGTHQESPRDTKEEYQRSWDSMRLRAFIDVLRSGSSAAELREIGNFKVDLKRDLVANMASLKLVTVPSANVVNALPVQDSQPQAPRSGKSPSPISTWTQIASGGRSWRVCVSGSRLTFLPDSTLQPESTSSAPDAASLAICDAGRVAGLLVDDVLQLSWINKYEPGWKPWFQGRVLPGQTPLRLLAVAMYGQDAARCMIATATATFDVVIRQGPNPVGATLQQEQSSAGALVAGLKLRVDPDGRLQGWPGRLPTELEDKNFVVTQLDAARVGAQALVAVAGLRDGQPELNRILLGAGGTNVEVRVRVDHLPSAASHLVVVRELAPVASMTVLVTADGVVLPYSGTS